MWNKKVIIKLHPFHNCTPFITSLDFSKYMFVIYLEWTSDSVSPGALICAAIESKIKVSTLYGFPEVL